jgi:hypothetical protein
MCEASSSLLTIGDFISFQSLLVNVALIRVSKVTEGELEGMRDRASVRSPETVIAILIDGRVHKPHFDPSHAPFYCGVGEAERRPR